jgi:hypothetical protein
LADVDIIVLFQFLKSTSLKKLHRERPQLLSSSLFREVLFYGARSMPGALRADKLSLAHPLLVSTAYNLHKSGIDAEDGVMLMKIALASVSCIRWNGFRSSAFPFCREEATVKIHLEDYYQNDIWHRAASVRAGWSPFERLQRTGLPPDIPWRLRRRLAEFRAMEHRATLSHRWRLARNGVSRN